MKLIESYLTEVARFLPQQSRDDILGELRTAIEEQVLDRAEAHGHEPGAADEKAVLQGFGHPLKVASGYSSQRHLIGPAVYPAFVITLKTLLILVLSLQIVVALIASYTAGFSTSLSGVIAHGLETALLVTGIVVAIFYAVEYSGEQLKWFDTWHPDSLRPGAVPLTDRGGVISNLVTESVFLLWWNDVLNFPNFLAAFGEVPVIGFASIWQQLYWPLNALFGAWFLIHIYVLVRGAWTRPAIWTEIALGIAALIVAAKLLSIGNLVVLPETAGPDFARSMQYTARMVVLVISGFVVWDLWLAYRHLRRSLDH